MKKYFEPEMNISTFSSEDVITMSGPGVTGSNSDVNAYTGAKNSATVSYDQLKDVIDFN